MCGIIGISSASHPVQGMLLGSLKRMEYRGYDSAGICTLRHGKLFSCKRSGKLPGLQQALREAPLSGRIGIGHTRWATHGAANDLNAHPHLSDSVAVVHNGIIENHQCIRARLEQEGVTLLSETDSEVIPWLFSAHLARLSDPLVAWRKTLEELEGSYAILALQSHDARRLWFARRGSPLLLGRRTGAVFAASDAIALAGAVDEVQYLREGEFGCISDGDCLIYDAEGRPVDCSWQPMTADPIASGRDGFRHYMEKEIHEQPGVMGEILEAYVSDAEIRFPQAEFLHEKPLPDRIVMVACGTSYHAALTARYWLERFLAIPVEVDVASEYRYRDPVIGPNTWLFTLSQSGETADTLEALHLFKSHTPENPALVLCNVSHSSLARESDGMIELLAGPEIGVASTKAFTAQLLVLVLIVLLLARRSGSLSAQQCREHIQALTRLPAAMQLLVGASAEIAKVASLFTAVHGSIYLGRGPCFPLALEGALKLKEISYLHAEGYAAGEMKHGPIALIDEHLPVVIIAPRQYHLEKVLSNLSEVQARGGKVILLTDLADAEAAKYADSIITMPAGDYFTAPLLVAVPLQLLAYHVARLKGTDIDQPRNLAKSVTVE